MKPFRPVLLLMIACLFLFSCRKEYSCERCSQDVLPAIRGSDTLFYYQLLLEDSSYYEAIQRPFGLALANSFDYGPVQDEALVESAWIEPNRMDDSTEMNLLIIERGIFRNYSSLDGPGFANYFSEGAQPFGELFNRSPNNTPIPGRDGFVVALSQPDGQYWRSDWAAGTQPGSYFSITDIRESPLLPNYYSYRVVAEFSCILYKTTGETRRIIKGRAAYWWSKRK